MDQHSELRDSLASRRARITPAQAGLPAHGADRRVAGLRQRADSTLKPLPDEEFAEGLAALERAAAGETTPTPVIDQLDLLVLR